MSASPAATIATVPRLTNDPAPVTLTFPVMLREPLFVSVPAAPMVRAVPTASVLAPLKAQFAFRLTAMLEKLMKLVPRPVSVPAVAPPSASTSAALALATTCPLKMAPGSTISVAA
jgi:hypothetical protein